MQTKLKALLFERKVSQCAAAKECGISERTLSEKMHGKVDFTFSEVVIICELLGIENPLDVFIPCKKKRSEMR